jgi:hypothetical protein
MSNAPKQFSLKRVLKVLLVIGLFCVIAFVLAVVGLEQFSRDPELRIFKDVACNVDSDCEHVDCTNLNEGVWYCAKEGTPVCNGNKQCQCTFACL